MQTIKHIIVYFLVFIMIIGLTSTFTAKEFIGQAREIELNGEDMLKMQVALNDANRPNEQDELKNNSQKDDEIIIEKDDKLDDADREVFEKGNSNEKIMEYQEILFKLEYLKANPDGKFGPMTEEAIISFQAEENIEKTGKLDIETQKALEKSEKLLEQDEDEEEQENEEQQQDQENEEQQQDQENEEQQQDQENEEQQESPESTNQGTNIEHIVKANETLSQISEKYSVTLKDIYNANNLSEASTINIGQKIIIPQN